MKQLLSLLLLCVPLVAGADERILRFHSDIRVFDDGMIEVAILALKRVLEKDGQEVPDNSDPVPAEA